MVKGINKTVIEVTNTESNYFERILFVVNPQMSSVSYGRLKKEAEKTLKKYEIGSNTTASLRLIAQKRKNKIKTVIFTACALVIAGIIVVCSLI